MAQQSWFLRTLLDARTIMLTSVAIALGLAVGHHEFYHSLAGATVGSTALSQSHNITIGTAFAFLIKAALTVALGTAYTQFLWHSLLNKEMTIAKIDSLSALNTSALQLLLDFSLTWQFSVLVFLAIVSWTISLATIFPPGALSIDLSTRLTPGVVSATFVDWHSSRLGVEVGSVHGGPDYITVPAAASNEALSALATGSIPYLGPFNFVGSSNFTFNAPAIQCDSFEWNSTGSVVCDEGINNENDIDVLFYVSWTTVPPTAGVSINDTLFGLPASGVPVTHDGVYADSIVINCSMLTTGFDHRTIYAQHQPPELHVAILQSWQQPGNDQRRNNTWSITTCQQRNATYNVNLSSNTTQQVSMTVSDYMPVGDVYPNGTSDPQYQAKLNYLAMMAIMDQTAGGTMTTFETDMGFGVHYPSLLGTPLVRSDEIQTLNKSLDFEGQEYTRAVTQKLGKADRFEYVKSQPLARMLEAVAANMTVAIHTSPNLGSVQDVKVTFADLLSIYTYNASRLAISYGVGVCVTAVITVAACYYVYVLRGSYSTKYSTFLRATPWEQAQGLCEDTVDMAADPAPSSITSARIRLGHLNQEGSLRHVNRHGSAEVAEEAIALSKYRRD